MTTINVYLKKTCFNITVLQSVTFVGEVLPDLNLGQWHSAKTP